MTERQLSSKIKLTSKAAFINYGIFKAANYIHWDEHAFEMIIVATFANLPILAHEEPVRELQRTGTRSAKHMFQI